MNWLFGNTLMTTGQKLEHLSMLAAMVSIGYIGYVAVKETRRGRR